MLLIPVFLRVSLFDTQGYLFCSLSFLYVFLVEYGDKGSYHGQKYVQFGKCPNIKDPPCTFKQMDGSD